MTGPVSVVVPAHDEEAVIGDCLAALLGGAAPGELDVVVVCNGCTDATAERARAFGESVTVVETSIASKPHALDLGDRHARHFPRAYLDADVVLSTDDLRAIVGALEGGALAASSTVRVDCAGASWPVRAYHRIWTRLPVIRGGLLGRGVYVLSEQGRRRFGAFPDIVADDYFVHSLFAPGERATAAAAVSWVRAPRTVRDLVRRKVRVFAGNQALRAAPAVGVAGVPPAQGSWLREVLRSPRLAPDALAYVAVTVVAKLLARRQVARGGGGWARDASSRAAARRP